jgi:NADH-quinone oxidoreductase subunit N
MLNFPDNWIVFAPPLTLTVFAVIGLLMAAWRGDKSQPTPSAGWVAAIGCAIALLECALIKDAPLSFSDNKTHSIWASMYVWDNFSRFFCGAIALAGMLVCLASSTVRIQCEYFALLVLSTIGLTFMVTSGNLLMVYLSLELSTICLFVLAGFYRRKQKSSEAALKFLITGGTSSAIFLFGVSWIYGAVGSTDFAVVHRFFEGGNVPSFVWVGALMVFAGLAFKIAAAPFHLWAPDVYEGAPSPISAFLSTASKGAGFVVLLRLVSEAFPHGVHTWVAPVIVLAVVTMTVGNLVAIVQTNVKRLLAYSGVAQAGFILIAVAPVSNRDASDTGFLALGLYLVIYILANVGAFLCVLAVSEDSEDHGLAAYDGLRRRSPMLAFAFLIFLLSLAGIPPLAGFVGKWFLFSAGMQAQLWGLVLFGAIASTVSLYYYLIVAKRMYINAPAEGAPSISVARPLSLAIGFCVLMTAVIGMYPAPWIAIASAIGPK